ncbi:hypothetical protein AX15_003703 [Amanita polypyramis BW_CC]|nr:hypothetical protein AX15_003703 [Amanita polypyramis BW_CC]
MSPPVAEPSYHDPPLDPRPLKRARKSSTKPSDANDAHPQFSQPAPVDHIFITDGIVTKKPGGKKAPLSCCECRRLKLKCDRTFPCASCKKRGCSEICPDGVLVSGKGTRFILANTEQLHTKIHEMSERIRCLEDALDKTQPGEHHPLMAGHLLGIKSTVGLYNSSQSHHDKDPSQKDASTSYSATEKGSPPSLRCSSEETFTPTIPPPPPPPLQNPESKHESPDQLANEVMRLSYSFPMFDKVSPEQNLPLRQYLRSKLPPRSEAEYLWEQACQNALWQYNPHPSAIFFPNLLHHCYESALYELCPRRLAVLFMIIAVGCQVDTNRPADTPDAERYHHLARASLCEIPVMEETNVETILALFYEIWYLLVFSDKKKAAGYAWGLMGLTAKLAQSIGLHRNGNKAKVIPEEVEKRRSLFWELLYLDARLSLSLGRPPSLNINFTDCPRPSYSPSEGCDPTESLHYYQEWKHSCYVQCLAPVLEAISNPSQNYSVVLELDKRIRDFSVPVPLRNGQSRALYLQKGSLSAALEAVLLQLHRTWFIRALSGPEEAFNRRHKYAPSVVAVFLSASRMVATIEDLFDREPELTSRVLGYWSNAFSSAVALCLLVSRAPFTCLSPAALQELQRARTLFTRAADTCLRASEVKPILDIMIDKTNVIYNRWSQGQEVPTVVLKHIMEDCHVEYEESYYPQQSYTTQAQQSDSFALAHQSLAQCIAEVHERAKAMFPRRKPCQCSVSTAKLCPPSHSWAPPPKVPQGSPVLPGLTSPVLSHMGLYHQHPITGATTVLPGNAPAVPSLVSPTSRLGIGNSLNIEIGAISVRKMLGSAHELREDDAPGADAARPLKRARQTPQPYTNSVYIGTAEEQHQHGSGSPVVLSESGKAARQEQLPPSGSRTRPEEKHRKLSCKECRRLKLKCDRVFPCQSCVKRGCSSLCPEGALTSGRGSRFILANTEQLHDKIFQLSDRVRQLEDALETLQGSSSNQPHPLLVAELRSIKTSQDLYTSQSAPSQQTTQSGNGQMQHDESVRNNMLVQKVHSSESPRPQSVPPEVPSDILQLSTSFPFPWSMDLSIRKRIRDALPPRAEAQATCEEARRNALWQYNVDASETFLPNLLHYCYTMPVEDLSPRRLALLLMVLSIGSLVDLSKPLGNLYGEAYHHLARAAVCEIPLMEEPDFDVLHTLFFMVWYHLLFSDNKKAVGYAWNLVGFVAKLAQGLGLHRDRSRLKRIPEEFEKRRAMFWELLNLDCRMSLSLGRPPSICLSHVDTKPPSYIGPGLYVPKEEIVYHEWKNKFFINCLTPILEAMIAVTPLDYTHILSLDSKVRDFDTPILLDANEGETSAPRFLNMQRALFIMGRNLALLQLHRRYFTGAMSGPETFDLHHQYSPSVLATYLGASSLIKAVQTLFDQEPDLSARFLHFWFNAFSAAVTLGLFISRAPSTPLVPYALQDLESISRLFLKAGKILPFSAKALPIIDKLVDKCRRSYRQHQNSNGHSEQPFELLPSFQNVHPALVEFAEQIKYTLPPRLPSLSDEQDFARSASDTWLPDIYRFSSVGLGLEDQYTFASSQPTPFTPSSPRVGQNENFNFDYGALTADLEETSYMAWF